MNSLSRRASVVLLVLGAPLCAALAFEHAASGRSRDTIKFFDAPSQTAEFIGYNRSIPLTPSPPFPRPAAKSFPRPRAAAPATSPSRSGDSRTT